MDLLKKSAMGFHVLLQYKYRFVLGRKGKVKHFTVSFEKSDFHHLAGLHKLKDNTKIRQRKRAEIFDSILSGEITQQQILKSEFYHEMSERLEPLCYLEEILDGNDLIFHYNKKLNKYSLIQAEYLIENKCLDKIIYLFLDSRELDNNEQMCRTFFVKNKLNYALGQEKYTLLRKEKINCITGEVTVLYNRL